MNPKLVEMVVCQVRPLTARVREYTLTTAAGTPLPTWSAGAHVALHLRHPVRGGLVRHYSLIGGDGLQNDPPHTYRIAIQREPHGVVSNWVHDTFEVGTTLRAGPPVQAFALDRQAPQVLLLAGGIGITPLVSMARSLVRRHRPFQLVYCGQRPEDMAYTPTLQALCGSALQLHCSDTHGQLDVAQLLAAQTPQTQVYVCGPTGLINACQRSAQALGWPEDRLRSEAFVSPVRPGDTPFVVTLQRSGRQVPVRADESLLDALGNARVPVWWDCRKGECGLCATRVLAHDGELVHRDRYLTEQDRQDNHTLCLCVSRLRGHHLVLDL
jgi:vanillate O-demethylase ferredoxin subunit